MSTVLRARRPFAMSAIAVGTDSVIAGVWLPAGSILTAVRGHVSLTSSTELLLNQAVAYGLEAWILPVEDPDSVVTMNALWDSHVPKDTSDNLLDLDADAADAAPFYEPGLITWEFLFDVGLTPRRISHRHKICSAANAALFFRQDTETPFLEHFFAGAVERFDIRRGIRVSAPSLAVFAVASSSGGSTSTGNPIAAMPENEWGRIKYIDTVLEMAMIDLLGLTEAGAESPWEEAASVLKAYLDPAMLENNAGVMAQTAWNASGELVFDVVVPGTMPTKVLTGGR